MSINPRYLNYCRYHGHTVDQQRAVDSERFPGGKMCGFTLHNREMWKRFWEETNKPSEEWPYKSLPTYADEFDRWLTWQSCMMGKVVLAEIDTLTDEQLTLLADLNREIEALREFFDKENDDAQENVEA